ncbi:MAG: hypothetical protein J3R72DRAFT_456658 [Linnemannia gamsii]|nr:MAG: hypothetical protein J3R72DRAFT_456658 [Linnemannia gamsii]
MASPLPSYLNPCLAASSRDSSTVYLIGVPSTNEKIIRVTTVNISDISNPVVKTIRSSRTGDRWTAHTPKVCFSYLGSSSPKLGFPIHIQQLAIDLSQQIIFLPESGLFENVNRFPTLTFPSRQKYAVVGHAGINSWAVAISNTTMSPFNSSWANLQWNSTSGIGSDRTFTSTLLSSDPFLLVGTFVVSAGLPAYGRLVVFDKAGAGKMYQTSTTQATGPDLISIVEPDEMIMNGIILTPDALYANVDTGAYILDKAIDGSVVTYFINPTISQNLQQVSTRNKPPPFPSSLAVTAAGPLIVLYSVTNDGPARFHFLNTMSKEWDMPYSPIPKPSPISESEGSNSAAVIGGAVGGVVLLVIVTFLFIRYRRQQRSKDNIQDLQFLDVDGITYDKTEGPSAKDYFATLEKPPLSEQRPQFPAGVGLVHGENVEGDLSVSLLGPQGFPLNPQRYKPPPPRVDPANLLQYAYTQPNDVQSPQDWSHHQRTNINNGMNGYIPPALRQPPTPPAIPTRPSNHVHYSLVQPKDNASSPP